ncbi:peroxide stress protein YaaA [Pseudooceanicola sp. 502str34]|uniref:peroxide stress protein YaaA n=1 Tax=Maritimibacter alkaliphilus TaxID=404236 RepID=UPI001C94E6B5|nr:peroxide stress protein YaaA [Maritimibacter alkaliphilus]MBY6090699.1 peroxide stress protein YaaA [Maritimibacter alkaliphilus]
MLIVVSPAKKLDWSERDVALTTPDMLDAANDLAGVMREKSADDIAKLMKLSADLSKLNRDRFQSYEEAPAPEALRPAALAFAGDTYQGLEAASLDPEELDWAQDHLRILSGLYGVLRPLDGIQPYRLEMGTRLKTAQGKSLYDYWGTRPAEALKAQAAEIGTGVLVNCASQEYFGAVDLDALGLTVVTPTFLERKAGQEKVISFYAKRARGAMARYVITHRLTDPAALKDFDTGGYSFDAKQSTETKPVFVRNAE